MLNRPKQPKVLKPLLRMLGYAKAPSVLGLIITYLMMTMPPDLYAQPKYASLECFAGDRAVTDAWTSDGHKAFAIDEAYDIMNDINSNFGFLFTLIKVIQTDLVVFMAPVCSSWVKLNTGTSGRSLGRPLGKRTARNRDANKMVSRVILLAWICVSLGLCFILEQPRGSWMELHPRFQEFVRVHGLKRSHIQMKEFLVDPG